MSKGFLVINNGIVVKAVLRPKAKDVTFDLLFISIILASNTYVNTYIFVDKLDPRRIRPLRRYTDRKTK